MSTPVPILLSLAALVAAALSPGVCSSNDEEAEPVRGTDEGAGVDAGQEGDKPVSGQVRRVGFVRLRWPDEPGDGGDAFASFVRFDAPVPSGELVASFGPEIDTCRIESDDDESGGEELFRGGSGRPFEFTSAGESVVFAGPDGPWLTLQAIDESDFRGYRPASRPVAAPYPANLSVDVPGADFPAFAAVPPSAGSGVSWCSCRPTTRTFRSTPCSAGRHPRRATPGSRSSWSSTTSTMGRTST